MKAGSLDLHLDEDDVENSVIRQRILKRLKYGVIPSLQELTIISKEIIEEDLERLISKTVDPKKSDYGVLTGIQIHGPSNQTFIQPSLSYCKVNGKHNDIDIHSPE
jgi:hypothetical protein